MKRTPVISLYLNHLQVRVLSLDLLLQGAVDRPLRNGDIVELQVQDDIGTRAWRATVCVDPHPRPPR